MINFITIATGYARDVHIGVATNFLSTLEELIPVFEEQTNHHVVVSFGSTGTLYAQIVNHAPLDIFLSADQKHPKLLVERGIAIASSQYTYAQGRIVLWSPGKNQVSIEHLKAGEFRRLAMANPKLAPYGQAAQETLDHFLLANSVQGKIIFGENIGQTFLFVHSGNSDVGFIALSQLLKLPEQERDAMWFPPEIAYTPIKQDAILLKRAQDNAAATMFLAFLRSTEARTLIERSGYSTSRTETGNTHD